MGHRESSQAQQRAFKLPIRLPLIGKLLGHKRATTTERYAHFADDPVRDAADRVQGRLADRLAKPPAKVEPLRQGSRRHRGGSHS